MATAVFPLPDADFDLTEVAVPWKVLTRAGHAVVFATERGTDEVRRLGGRVETGPFTLLSRGTDTDDAAAWVCEDGSYLSARWPGDAWLLAKRLLGKLPPAT